MKLKRYNEFITENVDKAKSILNKKMKDFDDLKTYVSKTPGYTGKFVDYLLNENVPLSELKETYDKLVALVKNNIKIVIDDLDYEELSDMIITKNEDLLINRVINKLPSLQKNIVRENLKKNKLRNLLLKLAKKEDLTFLLSKIDRYRDLKSLTDAFSLAASDLSNTRDFVLELIKTTKCVVTYDKYNILVLYVPTMEDLKKIASDTSWCILQEYNWNFYTKNRKQYVLYNFNKDEFDVDLKIGITYCKDGSLYACHNILDKSYDINKFLKESGIDSLDIQHKNSDAKKVVYDIDKIKSTTTLKVIGEILDSTSDKDQIIKLLKVVFGIFKKKAKLADGPYNFREITYDRRKLIENMIKKIFSRETEINTSDLSDIDSDLVDFVRIFNYDIRHKLVSGTDIHFDVMTDDILFKSINLANDHIILNLFNKDNNLYSFVDNRDMKFNKNKEVTKLIFDRVYDIYRKNKDLPSKMYINISRFIYTMSYIMGTLDKLPEKKQLEETASFWCCQEYDITNREVILPKGDIYVNSIAIIDNIIKRDYSDTFVFLYLDVYKTVSKLIEHLKDFKFNIKTKYSDMRSIIKEDMVGELSDKIKLMYNNNETVNSINKVNIYKM